MTRMDLPGSATFRPNRPDHAVIGDPLRCQLTRKPSAGKMQLKCPETRYMHLLGLQTQSWTATSSLIILIGDTIEVYIGQLLITFSSHFQDIDARFQFL